MRKTLVSAVLVLSCFGSTVAYAETEEKLGREDLLEQEKSITVDSYNPTEPEIQLGDVKYVTIDESGAVGLDTEVVQGSLNKDKKVVVDAVKGEDRVYYVLEKGGYIISLWGDNGKIIADDGSTVKIKEVDSLYGNNGLVDDEGFKSNIVPQGFLPKTGLGVDEDKLKITAKVSQREFYYTLTTIVCLLFLLMLHVRLLYKIVKKRKKNGVDQLDVKSDEAVEEEKADEKTGKSDVN